MNKPFRRRMLVWGGLAAVLAALLAVALIPRPVAIDAGITARGPLRVTADHEGKTRVKQRYVVSAPAAGRLLRIDLQPGDAVTKGKTVLATILPAAPAFLDARGRAEAESRVQAARAIVARCEAERERARAEQEQALSDLERYQRLYALQAVAFRQVEEAETRVKTAAEGFQAAKAAVSAASHELAAARAALIGPARKDGGFSSSLAVTAPVSGIVLRRLRESEAVIPQGEPLVELASLADLEVAADYLSSDAVKIRPGMDVLFEGWGAGAALRGKVRRVEPAAFLKVSALGVEEQRVWVVADFLDARQAWEVLGDGYRVEMRVVLWEAKNVLTVPTSALFRHGDGWAVFVVEGNRARLRSVETGQRNNIAAEVLGGLTEGEAVVVYPPDAVEDEVRVARRQA